LRLGTLEKSHGSLRKTSSRSFNFFLQLSLILTLSIPTSIFIAAPADAAACASGATSGDYTISPTHGEVFYIDTGVSPRIDAAYVGYRLVNSNSTAKSDLWVKLGAFTVGQISLANANDSLMQIPSLSQGSSNAKTAYFLLKASGTETSANHSHTMYLYQGNPNRGGSLIYSCDFTFTEIQETIKASANKVQTVSISNSAPTLGESIAITVTGTLGQPGNGKTPDGSIMWVTPAGFSTWPTNALRLESTSIILDQDGAFSSTTADQSTYTNQLLISDLKNITPGTSGSKINSSSQYRATYNFRVIGSTSGAFKVAPVAQIASGGQYKHSDANSTASGAFPSLNLSGLTSTIAVSKRVSPTARITNKSLTSNVATLTTEEAHGLLVNDEVYVVGVGSPFDGTFTITSVPTSTTFSFSATNVDIASAAITSSGNVFKKVSGLSQATIPYEVRVTATGPVSVDEIVDTPDSGLTFVTSSGQIRDVDRVTFTSIADPVLDSTESSLSPRPKHFIGPYSVSASTPAVLRYQMRVSTSSTATYSNTLYAKAGDQIVGTSGSANPKVVINTSSSGVTGSTETTSQPAPTIATSPISSLGSTTATLGGSTDPNGNSVSLKFQYSSSSSTLASGVTEATASPSSSSSGDPISISVDVAALSANTTYYYRAVLTYTPAGGALTTLNGEILTFKTNLVGSTSQTITWGTTFPTVDLRTTSSTTQNSTISQSGGDAGEYTGGDIKSSSGLFVDVTSTTQSICTVSTSSTFDSAVPPNELSAVYTINFLATGTCSLTASQIGNTTYAAATSVTKTITVIQTYVVTFNSNSSTSGSPSAATVTQASSGANVTLATQGNLARTGYSFGGWNTLADGTGTNYSSGATYLPSQNITLYANWSVDTYTVTFDGNSNTSGSAPSNQTKTYDVTLVLSSNSGSLARTGYTLAGWNSNSAGTGTSYALGGNYTTNAGTTLYAQWTADSLTITFNSQSGSAISNGSTTTGGTVTNPGNPTRDGFTFTGWFVASSGGSAITFPYTHNQTSNFTLYAQWIAAGSASAAYSTTTLNEAGANNGSISETLTVTLSNETFSAADGTNLAARVTNVPSGLTAILTVGSSKTVATLSFTGNAISHADLNDLSNLTITFLSSDFTLGAIPTGANRSNITINFAGAVSVSTNPASDVRKNQAKLNGQANETLTNPKFCLKTSSFSTKDQCDASGTDLSGTVDASGSSAALEAIATLNPSTTYYYILHGSSASGGLVSGEVRSFKTKPNVETKAPSSKTARSARLNATVSEALTNPRFCYKTTSFTSLADCLSGGSTGTAEVVSSPTSLIGSFKLPKKSASQISFGYLLARKSSTPSGSVVPGTTYYALSLSSLNPSTTYYYIIYGTVDGSEYDGGVQSFETASETPLYINSVTASPTSGSATYGYGTAVSTTLTLTRAGDSGSNPTTTLSVTGGTWTVSGGSNVTTSSETLTSTVTLTLTASSGTITLSLNTGASAGNYTATTNNSPTSLSYSVTIAQANQATLTAAQVTSTAAYTGSAYTATPSFSTTGGSGTGAVTYSVQTGGTASTCALSNSSASATLTATSVGTCLIKATKAADTNYNSATSANITFTFTLANQTITFGTLSNRALASGTFSVSATTTATGLSVSFSSTTTGTCTVLDTTVTLVAVGTCTINANQAGNSNYSAAAQVARSFTIGAAPIISSISKSLACFTGTELTISGSYISGGVVTLDGESVVFRSDSGSTIKVLLPLSAPGRKTITVTTPYGSAVAYIDYVSVPKPKYEPIRIPYLAQGDSIYLPFSATGASSYSLNGKLPAGLSFNTSTGLISGVASENGIFVFTMVATGLCGDTNQLIELDIDAPTPNAISHRINFTPNSCAIPDSAKASLERFLEKAKGLSPRNIIPEIYVSGGGKASDPNGPLADCRQEAICDFLLLENLLGDVLSDVFTGSENRIEIIVYWPRPNDGN